jgi:L,D-transpeptidase ErfK/SrfK
MTNPTDFKLKKSAAPLILVFGLTLLSGCQTLSSLFPEEEATVSAERPEPVANTIATHEFALSEGRFACRN